MQWQRIGSLPAPKVVPPPSVEQIANEVIRLMPPQRDLESGAELIAVALTKSLEAGPDFTKINAAIEEGIARFKKEFVESIQLPKDGADGADGRDGKDADPIDQEILRSMVIAAVQDVEIPVPKDGADGRDGKDADPVDPEIIRAMVAAKVAEIPLPKDGIDGRDGKDVDPDTVLRMVEQAVEGLPRPSDGIDGKDADPEVIRSMVREAVAEIPLPKDGRDGKDGQSIDMSVVRAMLEELVAAIPRPKDGEDGKQGERGVEGKDGRDGRDGKDAMEVVILPSIDPSKSYPRGTYAQYCGGVIHSIRKTDAIEDDITLAGWDVLVDGIHDIAVLQDDERSFTVKTLRTSGATIESAFVLPIVLDRGVFKAGETYRTGDSVTFGGSTWIAQKNSPTNKPGEGEGWRLAVKRGRDGKDGKDGRDGKDGKDGEVIEKRSPDSTWKP